MADLDWLVFEIVTQFHSSFNGAAVAKNIYLHYWITLLLSETVQKSKPQLRDNE